MPEDVILAPDTGVGAPEGGGQEAPPAPPAEAPPAPPPSPFQITEPGTPAEAPSAPPAVEAPSVSFGAQDLGELEAQRQQLIEEVRQDSAALESAREKLRSQALPQEDAVEYEVARRQYIASGMSPPEAAEKALEKTPGFQRARSQTTGFEGFENMSDWEAEKERQQAIADTRKDYVGEPTADYLRVWDTAQAKANLISSYIKAGVQPDEPTKALLSKELSPYLSATNQSFNIDIVGAVQGKVSENILNKIGISSSEIGKVRDYITYLNAPKEKLVDQKLKSIINDYGAPREDVQTEDKHWRMEHGELVEYVKAGDGSWTKLDTPESLPAWAYKYDSQAIAKDVISGKLSRLDAEQYFGKGYIDTVVKQQAAFDNLQGYYKGENDNGQDLYDLQGFIQKNPTQSSVQILKDGQFPQEAIDTAQKYVDATNEALGEIGGILKGKKTVSGQLSALTDAISKAGYYDTHLLGRPKTLPDGTILWVDKKGNALTDQDIARVQWDSLSEAQKAQISGYFSEDLYKGNYFAEYTKQMREVASEGGLYGSMMYAPILGVTVPLAKATTGQPVRPIEWATAGATAALDVLMVGGGLSVLGKGGEIAARGISGASGIVFATETGLDWGKMSNAQRALSVVMDTILLVSPVSDRIIAKLPDMNPLGRVKIPLEAGGEATVWKGIKVGSEPLVGISDGKIVLGTSRIEIPPLEEFALPKEEGMPFEPRTVLDTKVLTNRTALARAGMPEEAISAIENTLPEVRQFYGKKSPYLSSEMLTKEIDTLSSDGVETVLKKAVEDNKIVSKVYGSMTMRPQLSPEALAEWTNKYGRVPGDIDIQLKGVDAEGASDFAKSLVDSINSKSDSRVWISDESPTLIMGTSRSTGAIRHAIDIHYEGEPNPTPLQSEFSDMVYGLKKSAPSVSVKLEGVGKIDIARLSETGVGKTEQVLGWRIDPKTGEVVVRPEAHRLKDYVDLYEIIKTYNGKEAADGWATALGLDIEGLEEASKGTPEGLYWEFSPSEGGSVYSIPNISPFVQVLDPALLSASSSMPVASTSSGQLVSSPLYNPPPSIPLSVSRPSIEPSISMLSVSPPSTPSLSISEPSMSLLSISEPSVSEPSISPPSVSEPSVSPPSISPPSITPPSVPPPSISQPSVSPPSISPPSVSPPSVTPPFPPEPQPPRYPPPPMKGKEYDEQVKKIKPGTVVWVQGRPQGSSGRTNVAMYKVLPPPYRQEDFFTMREPPPGYRDMGWRGKGSVKKSLQIIGGLPENNIENIDLGWARININVEGGKPDIEYVHDKEANVGERSKTVGMGKGQIPLEEWDNAKAQGVPYEDFIRSYRGELVGGVSQSKALEEANAKPIAPNVKTYEAEDMLTPEQIAEREARPPVPEFEIKLQAALSKELGIQPKLPPEVVGKPEGGTPKVEASPKHKIEPVQPESEANPPESGAAEPQKTVKEPAGKSALSQRLDDLIGLDDLMNETQPPAEAIEGQPSEVPATVVQSYIRRKKPKNVKDWWESPYYENETEFTEPKRKTSSDIVTERTYLGHRILPPDLGGAL
jgi:hypothetical protein